MTNKTINEDTISSIVDDIVNNDVSKQRKLLLDSRSKLLLSNKTVLSNIMKECIPEYKGLPLKEIIKCINDDETSSSYIKGNNIEDYGPKQDKIYHDILFTSRIPNSNEKIGMYIDVEPQNEIYLPYDLLNRAMYYVARLMDKQKGEVFEKSDYDGIRKVYSIWICINPKSEQKDTINSYSFNEECIKGSYHTPIDYKKMNIYMLYLGDEYDNNKKGILEMLNLIFKRYASSNEEREMKLKKLNKDYDIILSEKEAFDMDSLARGYVQQGLQKGIQQGLKQAKISAITNMIEYGIPKDVAFKLSEADDSLKKEVNEILEKNSKDKI